MPPTVGGIQKRITMMAGEIGKHYPLIIIQQRGRSISQNNIRTKIFGKNNYINRSYEYIRDIIQCDSCNPLIYVTKPFGADPLWHIRKICELAQTGSTVILRLASTRSTNIVFEHRNELFKSGVELHCLNQYSYDVLRPHYGNIRLFTNCSKYVHMDTPNNQAPLAFCGRIVESKNVENLVYAWRRIEKNDFKNNGLCIWGEVKNDYGKNILNIIKKSDNVKYMGVYQQDNCTGIRKSSAIITPSYREGASNTVIEAMSYGKIVIGSDIPGIGDIIPGQYSFKIEKPFGIGQIYEAIIRSFEIINNYERYSDYAKQCYEHYLMHHSLDKEAKYLITRIDCLTSHS